MYTNYSEHVFQGRVPASDAVRHFRILYSIVRATCTIIVDVRAPQLSFMETSPGPDGVNPITPGTPKLLMDPEEASLPFHLPRSEHSGEKQKIRQESRSLTFEPPTPYNEFM
jgi:hypothetical protein